MLTNKYKSYGTKIISFLLFISFSFISFPLNAQRRSMPPVNPFSSGDAGGGFMNAILSFFGVIVALAVGFYLLMLIWGIIKWMAHCMRSINIMLVIFNISLGIAIVYVSWILENWKLGWSLLAAFGTMVAVTILLTLTPPYRHLRH
jgi:hypothetical protein